MSRRGDILLPMFMIWVLIVTALVLFLASPSMAQLPLQVKDGAVMENEEYLLQEIGKARSVAAGAYAALAGTNTFTGGNTFSAAVTFSSSVAAGSIVGPTTFTSSAAFSSVVSTITFSGWADIGLEKITCSSGGGSNECTASCSAGKRMMSCECAQVGTATQFYCGPSTWNATTENCRSYGSGVNTTAMAICARVK